MCSRYPKSADAYKMNKEHLRRFFIQNGPFLFIGFLRDVSVCKLIDRLLSKGDYVIMQAMLLITEKFYKFDMSDLPYSTALKHIRIKVKELTDVKLGFKLMNCGADEKVYRKWLEKQVRKSKETGKKGTEKGSKKTSKNRNKKDSERKGSGEAEEKIEIDLNEGEENNFGFKLTGRTGSDDENAENEKLSLSDQFKMIGVVPEQKVGFEKNEKRGSFKSVGGMNLGIADGFIGEFDSGDLEGELKTERGKGKKKKKRKSLWNRIVG